MEFLTEKEKRYTINKSLEEFSEIKNRINELNVSDVYKQLMFEEFQRVPKEKSLAILKKIIEDEPLNIKKIKINELIRQFDELYTAQNWNEAIKLLEIILELAIKEYYEIIFDKLYLKYEKLKLKLKRNVI
ncbi:MAG: hypothetical protein ACTSWR_11880 [Candidatus Helarchaeota archaeon]